MKWLIESDMAKNYIEKCESFVQNEEAFSKFKQDPDFNKILEGNELEVGHIALESIKKLGGYNSLLVNLGNSYVYQDN